MQNADPMGDAGLVAPPGQAPGRPLMAVGLMCAAVLFFTLTDASAKYLMTVGQLPLPQVLWIRFFGQMLAIIAVLGLIAVPALLRTKKLGLQLFRSLMLLSSTVFNFLALRHLRLDQATTINFLTPLAVALLAGPLLGEWVGWRRLVAILVGFGGIVLAVRPGMDGFEPAFLFSFACMLSYAVFALLTRFLAPYDRSEVTLFYSLLLGAILSMPFALMDWVWPGNAAVWVAVVSLGCWAAFGHYLFIVAHRFAAASTLSPFIYLSLITHSTAGFLLFGHLPDAGTLSGAAVVIASGLYILWRERVRAREAKPV